MFKSQNVEVRLISTREGEKGGGKSEVGGEKAWMKDVVRNSLDDYSRFGGTIEILRAAPLIESQCSQNGWYLEKIP
jgi:hypothetical protein